MSAENRLQEVTAEKLDRFEHTDGEPQETIKAKVTGLWWVDANSDREGQFSARVEYLPQGWVVYPEALADFLRSFQDVRVRPEKAATHIWEQLVTLLFDDEQVADERLLVCVEAETVADEYEIEIGDINQ